jgi:hypothetical protein
MNEVYELKDYVVRTGIFVVIKFRKEHIIQAECSLVFELSAARQTSDAG